VFSELKLIADHRFVIDGAVVAPMLFTGMSSLKKKLFLPRPV